MPWNPAADGISRAGQVARNRWVPLWRLLRQPAVGGLGEPISLEADETTRSRKGNQSFSSMAPQALCHLLARHGQPALSLIILQNAPLFVAF